MSRTPLQELYLLLGEKVQAQNIHKLNLSPEQGDHTLFFLTFLYWRFLFFSHLTISLHITERCFLRSQNLLVRAQSRVIWPMAPTKYFEVIEDLPWMIQVKFRTTYMQFFFFLHWQKNHFLISISLSFYLLPVFAFFFSCISFLTMCLVFR